MTYRPIKSLGQESANYNLLIKSDQPPVFVCPQAKFFFFGIFQQLEKEQYFITCENDVKFKFQCL